MDNIISTIQPIVRQVLSVILPNNTVRVILLIIGITALIKVVTLADQRSGGRSTAPSRPAANTAARTAAPRSGTSAHAAAPARSAPTRPAVSARPTPAHAAPVRAPAPAPIRPVVYFANNPHRRRDKEYHFNYVKVNGSWRAYILRMPSLGNRDESGVVTHRIFDNGQPYVCWNRPVTSLKDMQTISKVWADNIQEYIATGKRFG